jgi:hypothetical protein
MLIHTVGRLDPHQDADVGDGGTFCIRPTNAVTSSARARTGWSTSAPLRGARRRHKPVSGDAAYRLS